MSNDNRRRRRETTGGHRLSLDDVETIVARLQDGEKPAALARDYPVSRVMISLIASRKKWAVITRKVRIPLGHGGSITLTWNYDPRTISMEERQLVNQLLALLQQYPGERSASLPMGG